MTSPKLRGVILKEHRIEPSAETVDIKILKRTLLTPVKDRPQIGKNRGGSRADAHVPYGFCFQGDGIVEKSPPKPNPRYPLSDKHDPVRLFRIRAALAHVGTAAQQPVVDSRRALRGQQRFPPGVDFRTF